MKMLSAAPAGHFAAGQYIADEGRSFHGANFHIDANAAKYDFTIASNFMSTVDSTTMFVLNPWG